MKIFIFQNSPAPFRTPLFIKLGEKFETTVVYGLKNARDRYGNAGVAGYTHDFLKGVNIALKGKTLTYARGLGRYLRDHDFDVYIINDDWRCGLSNRAIVRAARRRGRPVFLWCGEIDTPYRFKVMIPNTFRIIYNLHMRRLVKKMSAFLAYGPKTLRYYERTYRIPKEKFICGTQAVALDPDGPVPTKTTVPEVVTFLFIGYLEQRKGVHDLIRAARQLDRDDLRLIIAGKGPEEERLKNMAEGDCRIEFRGYVEGAEKRKCYREADVMVSPTYHDPWANTINEACVYGLPIITTPAEGAEGSLALDGFNARIVPPGDIDKLRGALEFFLENKSAIPAMGKKSKALGEKFNIGWVVENFARAVQIALRDKQDD
jgi:glycosyltransferase involved in cell wall biosynthesis